MQKFFEYFNSVKGRPNVKKSRTQVRDFLFQIVNVKNYFPIGENQSKVLSE